MIEAARFLPGVGVNTCGERLKAVKAPIVVGNRALFRRVRTSSFDWRVLSAQDGSLGFGPTVQGEL